jgi:MFS family permease
MSLCWPLDDAIFSDLQKRLGKHGLHLIGLSQASYSVAYIIAPTFMGFLADKVGYNSSFAIIGIIAAAIGIFLLIITPRKLRMPQKELSQVQ